MIIKRSISEIPSFIAGDATVLKEIFHPDKEQLPFNYSLAHAELLPGQSSYPHTLEGRSELYVFLQGFGQATVGEEEVAVKAGDLVWVPPNTTQFVKNTGSENLVFLCIVDPPWKQEAEEVLSK